MGKVAKKIVNGRQTVVRETKAKVAPPSRKVPNMTARQALRHKISTEELLGIIRLASVKITPLFKGNKLTSYTERAVYARNLKEFADDHGKTIVDAYTRFGRRAYNVLLAAREDKNGQCLVVGVKKGWKVPMKEYVFKPHQVTAAYEKYTQIAREIEKQLAKEAIA